MIMNKFLLSARSIYLTLFLLLFPLILVSTSPVMAADIRVAAGKSLQTAINAAKPGDRILLLPGVTYTGPFTLPNKVTGSEEWIEITTDGPLPAAGVRVTPGNETQLAKLKAAGGLTILKVDMKAHHYKIVGVEIVPVNETDKMTALVTVGVNWTTQNTIDKLPHHIRFERVYIHGKGLSQHKRAFSIDSQDTDIVDSYISNIKFNGADAQAILACNGGLRIKILNNFIEGSGENLMIGGCSTYLLNDFVPAFWTIAYNHFSKPLSWKGGPWTIKNLFELKAGEDIEIFGNIFEQNWSHAQTGTAILFKVATDNLTRHYRTRRVNFHHNIVRFSGSGVSLLARDYHASAGYVSDIQIHNNLFYGIESKLFGGSGNFLAISEGGDNYSITHNTVIQSGQIVTLSSGRPITNFVFTDNLVKHGSYGFKGDSLTTGLPSIARYLPGSVIKGNVMIGGKASLYPAGNYFPATIDGVGFRSLAQGDYRLGGTSLYRGKGTDGKDIGADMDALSKMFNDMP